MWKKETTCWMGPREHQSLQLSVCNLMSVPTAPHYLVCTWAMQHGQGTAPQGRRGTVLCAQQLINQAPCKEQGDRSTTFWDPLCYWLLSEISLKINNSPEFAIPYSEQLLFSVLAVLSSHISQIHSSLSAYALKDQTLIYPQTFLLASVYVFTLW